MDEPHLPGTAQPAPPYRLILTITPSIHRDWSVLIERQDLWTDETHKLVGLNGLATLALFRAIRDELHECGRISVDAQATDALRRAQVRL